MENRFLRVFFGIVNLYVTEQRLHVSGDVVILHRHLCENRHLARCDVEFSISAEQIVQRCQVRVLACEIEVKIRPLVLGRSTPLNLVSPEPMNFPLKASSAGPSLK